MKSLDLLLAEYGYGCAFYTGDGGGLILAPRCPKIRLRNAGELTGQILRRNALFSLDEAAAVMRLDRGGFEARVHEHFMAYPETELRDKFGHFSIFEHLYRLSYEGEDRVRFFFWSNTPFYGMPFFYRAMLLSDYNKDNHRLFAEFHKRLDPRIARIKYANWGFPISSPITPFYLAAKNWAIDRPAVSRLIRRGLDIRRVLARGGKIAVISDDAALLQNLARGIIAETPGLDNYLDTKRILEYLRRWSGMLQLYSINNILVYLSNLIRSGNEPGLGE
jgi:asparagine synthase (glutamine-hydrolysing)